MHLVTSTLSRSISAMLRLCHQIIELRLMPVCPARGRGTTTTWQRLLPPNQGDFQCNVNDEGRVIWILPNRCSSSANRQSSVEAVAKFSQDDQGLWIERWHWQCFQLFVWQSSNFTCIGPSWVSWPMFPLNNVFKLHCESNCRHVPHRVSDLAVNSKKVEEV